MSSQEFTCHVWSAIEDAKRYFSSFQQMCVRLPAQDALDSINAFLGAEFAALPRLDVQIVLSDELEVRAEFGSEVPYELIEALVAGLETIDGVEYKARYFDSSSGGVNAWGDFEDLDLDRKNIFLLGDMSEECEYLQEAVEGIGELHSELAEDTDIIILGANPNTARLTAAKAQGVEFITEDQFLECLSIQP